jgi:hypothetical protein
MLNPRKQIDRIGCEPVKYAFSIQVILLHVFLFLFVLEVLEFVNDNYVQVAELVVPKDTNIPEGALLSVCFERGSKISSTQNKVIFAFLLFEFEYIM